MCTAKRFYTIFNPSVNNETKLKLRELSDQRMPLSEYEYFCFVFVPQNKCAVGACINMTVSKLKQPSCLNLLVLVGLTLSVIFAPFHKKKTMS